MALHWTTQDRVATVTLDDPGRRNALDVESATQLTAICDEIAHDTNIGAAIVQGAHGTFSSGADRAVLRHVGEDPAEPERFEAIDVLYDAFVRVGQLPVPTIAAVRGAAVGAGVNLMLATDLRVVATDARILAGFLRIGIHPGGGHFALLGRTTGREAAAAIGLFGEEISGSQAQTVGLAWEAVDDATVEPRAFELAARIAHDPELARRAVASFRHEVDPPGLSWQAGLAAERAPQMWSLRRQHARTQP